MFRKSYDNAFIGDQRWHGLDVAAGTSFIGRLGHHSAAFTLDTYAHVIPGMQRSAAQGFADELFDDKGDRDAGPELSL